MTNQRVERVDEIPLILHWLKVMRIAEIIDTIWKPHGNWQGLSYGQLAVLFITYVIHCLSHRLSGMEEWVIKHKIVLEQATGWEIDDKDATDDRLGTMIGEVGSIPEKRIEFQRQTGQYLIQAFELPTDLGRYDTTSLNVHHSLEKNENGFLSLGHSKDKRPDLLQFKQGLAVLDPAGIPIFSETIAGKDADDPLYVPAWQEMSKTIGKTDFLFVTDNKGGALETRATIDKENGYYLCPLAMTGKIPEELKTLVLNPPVKPVEIKLEGKVDKKGNPLIVGQGFVVDKDMEISETNIKHSWKERWLIVQSYAHAARQNKALMGRIKKAKNTLTKFKPKKDESLDSFRERAEQVVKKYGVEGIIEIEVKEIINHQKRYTKRGRPNPNTPYKLISSRQLELDFETNQSIIEEHQALAGWRIYVTNTSHETMTLEQSVRYYRDEWLVERSFHRFKKGNLPVLPLFLRLPERIKGLMLLLVVALQVFTLMEFVIRRELAQQEETLAGLVPGNPSIRTARPTAERIINQFNHLHLIIINTGKRIRGHLLETLTPLQQHILELLRIPLNIYENLSFNQLIPS